MKYLKNFNTIEEYKGVSFDTPNVSYIIEDNAVKYNNITKSDNTVIWYTSNDGNIVTPYQTRSLPEIATNTYVDGKGVIKFKTDVTRIGDSAFRYCQSLTSITIPNSVTSIERYAFDGCYSLTSVTIPNKVTRIGEGAFEYCRGLTSITIPNSVTSIGDGAFSNCDGLTSPVYNAHCFAYMPTSYSGAYAIPEGIKQIAGSAFYSCTSVTSINIPNSVISIGDTFVSCESLTSIHVDSNNPNYSSVDGVLFNKDKTTLIRCPRGKWETYIIPNSVTNIGDYAFSWCRDLTSITIPNSVTSIGYETFLGCTSVTSVTIPNSVTSIGYQAFKRCDNLKSITIPESVTSIGDGAFSECSSLTSITCKATTPPILGSENSQSNVTVVYVPAESVEAYKTATNWSYYADKIYPIQ